MYAQDGAEESRNGAARAAVYRAELRTAEALCERLELGPLLCVQDGRVDVLGQALAPLFTRSMPRPLFKAANG